jgi:hypothetical protein
MDVMFMSSYAPVPVPMNSFRLLKRGDSRTKRSFFPGGENHAHKTKQVRLGFTWIFLRPNFARKTKALVSPKLIQNTEIKWGRLNPEPGATILIFAQEPGEESFSTRLT